MCVLTKIKNLYYANFDLLHRINTLLLNEESILDAGCGKASCLKELSTYKIGLDYYLPYIMESKKNCLHDAYILGSVLALPLRDSSVDASVCTEVIEHLSKEEAKFLLVELERVSKHIVVLTTPNGFLELKPGPLDNPSERHLSGFSPKELRHLGYRVYGLSGLKCLFKVDEKGQAVKKYNPQILSLTLLLSQIIVYRWPNKAFQLLAIKYLDDEI